MEPSLAELTQTVQNTINSLRVSLDNYRLQNQEVARVIDSLASNVRAASDGALIDIGEGIWVHMTQLEAIAYYRRKTQRISCDIERTENNIQGLKSTFEGMRSLDSGIQTMSKAPEVNDEGLPIIDIQEDLDIDGNVTGVKLNDRPFSPFPELNNEAGSPVEAQDGQDDNLNSEQIKELMEDMELWRQEDEVKMEEKATSPNSHNLILTDELNTREDLPYSGINQSDILELELIANDLDIQDDPEEEESDNASLELEDDVSDPDLDGQFSLLPTKSTYNDRLWKEIQKLREEKLQGKSDKTKRVRFKETLEINEIENVGDLLQNIEHEKQTVLRFKENLILSGRSGANMLPTLSSDLNDGPSTDNPSHLNDDVTTDVFEKSTGFEHLDAAVTAGPVTKNNRKALCEKTKSFHSQAGGESELRRASIADNSQKEKDKTNQESVESSLQNQNKVSEDAKTKEAEEFESLEQEVAKDRKKKATSRFKRMISQNPNQNPLGRSRLSPLDLPHPHTTISEQKILNADGVESSKNEGEEEVNDELAWKQKNIESLMSAYNSGSFDDDLEASGPIVNELNDFERLNLIIKSMSVSNTEKDDDSMSMSKPDIGTEYEPMPDSDDEIVLNEIQENEYDPVSYDIEEDDSIIEHDIIQREVESNYYRLREKIYEEFGKEFVGSE